MRVLVAVYAAVLGLVAVGFALLAGTSGSSGDAWLVGRGLILSAVAGIAAVACGLRSAGRPVRPALLLLGLLPAAIEAVWLLVR